MHEWFLIPFINLLLCTFKANHLLIIYKILLCQTFIFEYTNVTLLSLSYTQSHHSRHWMDFDIRYIKIALI